jgi:repressor LexA
MKLNQKERIALKFIRNSLFHGNKPPTIRDIMNALDYQSPRSAMIIVNGMIDKKILRRDNDNNLKITKDPEESKINAKTVDVPLVGYVSCGTPLLAEENIEMTVPVSIGLAKPPLTYFLLRAMGNSMNMAGINNDDLVLVRQQPTAENGDKVVALIDNEATIKEFYRAGDTVILKPRSTNKKHQPIILTDDFIIQGVVIKTLPNIK